MMIPQRTLSQVAMITMCTSPKGDTYNQDGSGLPLLNGPTEFGPTYPNCTLFSTDSKRECRPGDLIFCVRGSTTGRMNWADRVYSLGRGVCSIRGEATTDTRFIKYCLDWKLEALLKYAGGGTFPNLTQDTIRDFEIPFPEHRRKIAAILSSYDDLIENNLRRIKILEEMAQNLYREWFVKFRFPGHQQARFIDSSLGSIPEGWEAVKLGDLIEIRKGKNITKNTVVQGSVPVVAGGMSPAYYHNAANTRQPVITISASGANAGFICLYYENVWASDCSVIDLYTTPYVYFFYLQLKYRHTEVTRLQRGSAQPHVYPKDLMDLDAVKVPSILLDRFNGEVTPIIQMIRNLTLKNSTLRRTCDLLLPRLISGEVDVSELDIAVPEEANA